MTFLHFVDCAALLIAPAFVIYYATALGEERAVVPCFYGVLGYGGTQLIKMVVLATFMPSVSAFLSFNVFQEVLKVVISWLDLCLMGVVLSNVPGKHKELRVLGVGLGWGAAEAIVLRIVPLWMRARAPEWDWSHLCSVLEANSNLLQAICFAQLVARYQLIPKLKTEKDSRKEILIVIAIYTLVSGVGESFLRLALGLGPFPCLLFHVACVGALWYRVRQTKMKI
ncbi:transmembrane protein 147-like [Pelomyxa schiedti]|nr:transmembrane protein 147-like [Pelomyxa schiedti]